MSLAVTPLISTNPEMSWDTNAAAGISAARREAMTGEQ
jgi:hypothetical protein